MTPIKIANILRRVNAKRADGIEDRTASRTAPAYAALPAFSNHEFFSVAHPTAKRRPVTGTLNMERPHVDTHWPVAGPGHPLQMPGRT